MANQYFRPKQVAERYSVTISTIWRWAGEPRFAHLGFPKPVEIGPGARAFKAQELDEYDARRESLRDSGQAA